MAKPKEQTMWCEHCNAHISFSGIASCLRKTCKTIEPMKKLRERAR